MVAEPGMDIVVTVAGACQNTVLRSQSGRGCGAQRSEVGAFYWTDLTPDIVNSGREEQGSISV